MGLELFPRPKNDNGIGMHFGLDARQKDLDLHLPMLAALRVKWVVFYTTSPDQAVVCVRAAGAHGMQAVIRPKARIDEPFDFGAYARALPGQYIQIYNEPGNPREWRGRVPEDYIPVWAARWREAARQVAEAGAYPGLQVMGSEEAFPALNGLAPNVAHRVWMASHAYPSNHPPGYWVPNDDVAQLKFLMDAQWAKNALGFIPPVIVTEGGYQYGQLEDNRYARIDDTLHAAWNVALYEQFHSGVLANGESLPDYLFAICPWLWSHPDWTSWYAGIDGTRQKTIDAVKAMPVFVRKFSDDSSNPQLSDVELACLMIRQDFPDPAVAVAIVLHESGGNAKATNRIGNTPPDSYDRGLWQFNSYWHRDDVTDDCAYDPVCSTRAAFGHSKRGTNWGPWKCYRTGLYKKYMERAKAAVAAAGGRGMYSKLTFHLSAYPDRIYENVNRSGVKLLKVYEMDSEMNLDELKRQAPAVQLIVYRHFIPGDLKYKDISPDAVAALLPRKLFGRGLVWEGPNENLVGSRDDLIQLNLWYLRFAEIMHSYGEKTAAFSFSTGNPVPALLPYLGELRAAIEANDYIALHEYHTNFGYYREIYNALPVKKPILITEMGYDVGGTENDGYRGRLSDSAYLQLLWDYDQTLLQDPYVLGATIFQVGDPRGWHSFDIVRLVDVLAGGIAARGGGAPFDYTPPEPPEPPNGGVDKEKLHQIAEILRQIAGREGQMADTLKRESVNILGAANYIDQLLGARKVK